MKVRFDSMFVLLLILQHLGHCQLFFVLLVFSFIQLLWLALCVDRKGKAWCLCAVKYAQCLKRKNGHYILIIRRFSKCLNPLLSLFKANLRTIMFCFHMYTCRSRMNKFQIRKTRSRKFATLIIYASDGKLPPNGITAVFFLNVEL